MPMSQAGNRWCRSCRCPTGPGTEGFSLVEMLVVIVIIASIASIVSPRVLRPAGRPAVALAAIETAQRARAVRADAVHGGFTTVLQVDLAERLIHGGSSRALALRPDIAVDLVAASSERVSATIGGIRFFANGASTGGTIRLTGGGVSYEVRINWFNGRISVAPS